ncbi:S8 family serine peptidase [Aquimarina pacifica]|uniref:S8 family serine peptidase n=1 Tax=Aquimarina pacifica TaxID=1296415 RepID=UPI000472007D|nr:S8 family serine peptidase [Aquimarina pacifica]
MKSSTSLLYIISIYIFTISCSYNELDEFEIEQTKLTSNSTTSKIGITMPTLIETSLIIRYRIGVKESDKKALRDQFKVIGTKKCNCTNTYIEQWEFSVGTDIEGRKDEITQDGVGIEGVDFQFNYPNQNMVPFHDPSIQSEEENRYLIKEFIGIEEPDVSIAILDTGIDLRKLIGYSPTLYKTNDESNLCVNNGDIEISGWDFMNSDSNTYDDNGHGTAVTGILANKLHNEGVQNYSILPVKIFDDEGKGTTFTTLCGYAYAVSKPGISIINMSFGWYGHQSVILSQLIAENPKILNISSSGNTFNNNDFLPHYPSSYTHKNLFSIGSINKKKIHIASFSNHGSTSVDFLSLGDQVPTQNTDGVNELISGTSFATPIVTGKSALYITEGYSKSEQVEERLEINGTILSTTLLPVKYSDIIIE